MPRKPAYLPFLGAIQKKMIECFLKGYSHRKFYDEFIKGKPWAMRYQTSLNYWREFTGSVKLSDVWRFVRKTYRYGEDLYIPSSMKMYKPYFHKIGIRVFNTERMQEEILHTTIASDHRLTPFDIEEHITNFLEELSIEYPQYEVYDWKIVGLFRRKE